MKLWFRSDGTTYGWLRKMLGMEGQFHIDNPQLYRDFAEYKRNGPPWGEVRRDEQGRPMLPRDYELSGCHGCSEEDERRMHVLYYHRDLAEWGESLVHPAPKDWWWIW